MADGKEQRGIATPEKERAGLPAFWPEDFDRIMDRFFARPMRGFWRMRPAMGHRDEWLPDMDAFEQEGKIVARFDLPGTRREEKEVKEDSYYWAERAGGSFYRSVRIPEGTKTEAIEASYEDGVLEVRVPRPATAEPRKLKVAIK